MCIRDRRYSNQSGAEEEFDVDRTIDETSKKAGILQIRYKKPRRNTIKVPVSYTHLGLCVRVGGAPGGDDALAMSISHMTGWKIQWVYLMTDLIVLGLSISYIPLTRIGYSILTVILSGQIVGILQRIPLPNSKKEELA